MDASTIAPPAPRSGRPSDEDLTRRILTAGADLLDETGYAAFRVEQLARRVECGKAAIYRRYPDKATLITAILLEEVEAGDTPDTGAVRDDLLQHAQQNQRNQQNRRAAHSSHGLLALFDPDVFPLMWEAFFRARRAQGLTIIDRAIARGELPDDVDPDIILDTIAGLTLYRQSIKRFTLDARHYVDIIDALVTTPPRRLDAASSEDSPADVECRPPAPAPASTSSASSGSRSRW